MESCRARIWDNGDTTNCGNTPVVREQLCARCLRRTIRKLEDKVIALDAKAAGLKRRIAALCSNALTRP